MNFKLPILVFALVLLNGAFLGLTDDEAYYWVLAQKPALGYAYHPPAIAWSIAIPQWLFGLGVWVVRLPAALYTAGIIALALHWMRLAGVAEKHLWKGALVLFSFAGFFSLSWMMVPDLPLFFGWTLAFVCTWQLCFGKGKIQHALLYILLTGGITLAVLSKYSGVLAAASACLALLIWAPRDTKRNGLLAVALGTVAASIPIILWNASHEWASILYQIKERQGGGISLLRYARFWIVELLFAGPVLVAFMWIIFKNSWLNNNHVFRFISIWIIPGLIFCIQPLWADFKPHWAFIVWWPTALGLAWAFASAKPVIGSRWVKGQIAYGLTLGVLVLLSCHLPIGNWMLSRYAKVYDPRLDVTNDLYGWTDLRDFLTSKFGDHILETPVIGSRYQTASQAAFNLGSNARVTLLPRDIKSKDEWPSLNISDHEGPNWPRLTTPILYVSDNRYDAGPEFAGARCTKIARLEKTRWNYLAKMIDVWRCEPGG